MNTRRLQKRYAVLLNADVVGFSSMMAHDSRGTIHALLESTRWLSRVVERFGGRVVDAPGDNLMAEFVNEAEAVKCAMHVQWHERTRNRHLPEHLQIRFRIGIQAGEVFDLGGRLYGNAVNISARLQGCADPGGILVSEDVAERCRGAGVRLAPERSVRRLKNIPEPIGSFAVAL